MKKGTILTIAFLGVIGYLSVTMILTGNKFRCNVCITYNGIEICQDVEGMEKNDVIQNGVSTACAGAASGRTESMDCGMTPPTKVVCEEL
ncbi:MAG: hypothetical protein OEZ51_08610 [Nitrospinota bacterium]|nr:hypothetical protein [Nitrospinota bacterium]